MRATRWAWEGYLPLGKVSSLVGVGGAGKGTFMAWTIAYLSRGGLPGEFKEKPATTLIIGDEDSTEEIWIPRIIGAGGDVSRVFTVDYEDGMPLQAVRDTSWLEEQVRELDVNVIYFDQILDNFAPDSSTHVAGDVRQTFSPLRSSPAGWGSPRSSSRIRTRWAGRARRETAQEGRTSSPTCRARRSCSATTPTTLSDE
jgi:AAA domain